MRPLVTLALVPIALAAARIDSGSPERQALAAYVGRWSESGRMRDDPKGEFKSVAGGETCSWAAGGSAVLCQEKFSGPGGASDGVYILSWDSAGKQYHVYGTEHPGNNMHATGQLAGDTWTWFTDPAPDGSRMRYVFVPKGKRSRTMTVDVGSGDSWATVLEITYTLK